MSHQDKASRVSIFPLSGQAWWEVFRLHFHYVPFISGASVFPSPWGRVTGGRCRSVTFWPEVTLAGARRWRSPPRDPPRPRRCLDGPRSVCRRRSEAVRCPRVRVRQTPSEAGREASGHLPRLCLSPGRREEVGEYTAPQEPPAGRSQPHAAALRSGPVILCGTGFRCRSWLVGGRISA